MGAHACNPYLRSVSTPATSRPLRVNGRLPLVLEIEVRQLGLECSKTLYRWGSHVVVDRNLVTGQNPFSSEAMAKQFLDLLVKP